MCDNVFKYLHTCKIMKLIIFCIFLLFSHEMFYTQAKVKKCIFFAVFCFINFSLRFKLNHFASRQNKIDIFCLFSQIIFLFNRKRNIFLALFRFINFSFRFIFLLLAAKQKKYTLITCFYRHTIFSFPFCIWTYTNARN